MTIEEIESTLQTVAENQARFYADVGELNDQTAKLIDAQLAYESRQARIEEAFKQVAESHQMLVELARIQAEQIKALIAANASGIPKPKARVSKKAKKSLQKGRSAK